MSRATRASAAAAARWTISSGTPFCANASSSASGLAGQKTPSSTSEKPSATPRETEPARSTPTAPASA
ncbi:MAG: hypothetical protein WD249_12215 [Gaiellaceae bacterium]